MQRSQAIALTGISIALFAAAIAALPSASAAPTPQSYDPSKVFDETFNNFSTALDVTDNPGSNMEFFMDCSNNDADYLFVNQTAGRDLNFHIQLDTNANQTRYEAWLYTPEHFTVVHLQPVGIQFGTDFDLSTTTRLDGRYYLHLGRCINVDGFYNISWSSSATSAVDDGNNHLGEADPVSDGSVVNSDVSETTDHADFLRIDASFTPPPNLLLKLDVTGCPVPPSIHIEFYNSTGVALEFPTPVSPFESGDPCLLTTQGYALPGSGVYYLRIWTAGVTSTYSVTVNLVFFSPSRPTCQDFSTTCVVTDNTVVSGSANALDYTYERSHYYKLFLSENDTIWVNATSTQIDIRIRLFNDPSDASTRLQKAFQSRAFTGPEDYQEFFYRMTATELAATTGWYFIQVEMSGDLPPSGLYTLRVWLNDAPISLGGTASTNEDEPLIGFDLNTLFFDLDCKLGDVPDCSPRFAILGANLTNLNFTLTGGHFLDVTSTANWSGTGCRMFQAWDPKNATNTSQLCVTVLAVNDVPEVLSPPAQTQRDMTEDQTLAAVLVASWFRDADGDVLTYDVQGNDNLTIAIDQQNGLFDFTPEPDFNGLNHLTFMACDVNLTCATWEVDFVVGPVNDAPETTESLPFINIVEDGVRTMDLLLVDFPSGIGPAFKDKDGDTLTFGVNDTEADLVATILGSVVTITLAPNEVGLYFITVYAVDPFGLRSPESLIRVTVTAVNDPPSLDSFTPLSNPTVAEDASQTFTVVASDPDGGDVVHYQWSVDGTQISTAQFDSYTLRTLITSEGNRSVIVLVNIRDENGASINKSWTLFITNTNQAPAIPQVTAPQLTVKQGEAISFSAVAADPDNDQLTYTWYSDKVATSIGSTQTITLTNLPVGVNVITVEVSDGHTTVTNSTTITVTSAAPPSTGEFPIVIVLVIALAAVGGLVGFMMMKRRKPE